MTNNYRTQTLIPLAKENFSNNRPNILILSYLEYPSFTGLCNRIRGLANALSSSGINVTILCPSLHNNLPLIETHNRVTICRIPLGKFKSGCPERFESKLMIWFLFSIKAFFFTIKTSIKTSCLIQFQSIYSALPIILSKFIIKAKVIGDDIILTNSLVDNVIIRTTDVIITASTRTYLKSKLFSKATIYLPNGIEVLKNNFSDRRQENYFIPRIIFVGALTFDQNRKAVENLIAIAEKLKKNGLKFEIDVVGGPLSSVESLSNISKVKGINIKFLGKMSSPDLEQLYRKSSIGILPFFNDTPLLGGQRTKALDYFARNLLVVSGPEGVKSIEGLQAGEHYLLANSINEMVDVLTSIIIEPTKSSKIASKGAIYVNEHFAWKTLSNEYIAFVIKSGKN